MILIWGLIGANLPLFLLWQYRTQEAVLAGVPRGQVTQSLLWMFNNLAMGVNDFQEGKWWTHITAHFFHTTFQHLTFNLVTFYYMGALLAATPGITPFQLALMTVATMVVTDVSVLSTAQEDSHTRCLGFSAVTSAFVAAAGCMYPRTKFHLLGIIPIPGWAVVLGYSIHELVYRTDTTDNISHEAHLTGLLMGASIYFLVLRKTNAYALRMIKKTLAEGRALRKKR
jgi:membrane associated rhomboid family serine protease